MNVFLCDIFCSISMKLCPFMNPFSHKYATTEYPSQIHDYYVYYCYTYVSICWCQCARQKKRTQFLVISLKLLLCEFSFVFEASFFALYSFFSFTMLTHLIIIILVLGLCAWLVGVHCAFVCAHAKHEAITFFAIYSFYSCDFIFRSLSLALSH